MISKMKQIGTHTVDFCRLAQSHIRMDWSWLYRWALNRKKRQYKCVAHTIYKMQYIVTSSYVFALASKNSRPKMKITVVTEALANGIVNIPFSAANCLASS